MWPSGHSSFSRTSRNGHVTGLLILGGSYFGEVPSPPQLANGQAPLDPAIGNSQLGGGVENPCPLFFNLCKIGKLVNCVHGWILLNFLENFKFFETDIVGVFLSPLRSLAKLASLPGEANKPLGGGGGRSRQFSSLN